MPWTPTTRSPKIADRRSPKSPASAEKRRLNRSPELENLVGQLQGELKEVKDQLSSSESAKHQMQHEAEMAKEQLEEMTAKLELSQKQLLEFSAAEDLRLQELRKISLERDRAWQSELKAMQNQQSVDAAALSSSTAEILRLKQMLELPGSQHPGKAAPAEVSALRQEVESKNASIAELKTKLLDAEKEVVEAQEEADDYKQQFEMAKASMNSLSAEGIQLRKCLSMTETRLEEATARIGMLEEIVMKLQHSENTAEMQSQTEIEQLRSALNAMEVKHQEEQMQKTAELSTVYDLLKSVREGFELQILTLEDELRKRRAAAAELETELTRSAIAIAELKANLMDKETAMQSLLEDNGALRSRSTSEATEVQNKYEAAMAELKHAQAAEQDVRMRLELVTEEADKSSRHVARVSEQLEAAQAARAEMEDELQRLRVQSDQWRKAAEAAAAVLASEAGGNDEGLVDRVGSMEPEYNSVGRKLTSSPFCDDLDAVESSPKRRSVLRRMSGLWKKTTK